MRRRLGRRAVSLLLIALVATGCTRTVDIPLAQLEGAAPEHKGKYRIWMVDSSLFVPSEFTAIDSTIVITKLSRDDERYGRAELPMALALREVRTIEKFETRGVVIDLIVLAGMLAVAAFYIYLSADTDDTLLHED